MKLDEGKGSEDQRHHALHEGQDPPGGGIELREHVQEARLGMPKLDVSIDVVKGWRVPQCR